MLNLMPIFSFQADPRGAQQFSPVTIAAAANFSLGAKESEEDDVFGKTLQAALAGMPEGRQEIGLIPFAVPDHKGGNDVIVAKPGSGPITIPVNANFASLLFLHTCYYPKDQAAAKTAFRKRVQNYIFGIPIGKYRLVYADGSATETELRYGRNILELIPYPPARFLPGCRYVWSKKLENAEPACLYLYEWINPNPEKKIEKVVLERGQTEADLALIGLTGRNLKGGGK